MNWYLGKETVYAITLDDYSLMASENASFGQDKKLSISRFQYSFFPPVRMLKKPTKKFEAQMIKSPLKI